MRHTQVHVVMYMQSGSTVKYIVYLSYVYVLSLSLQTVFLFTDGHVAQEGFLELVNNMLTSGMVPALYPDDEKEAIIGQV